MRKLSYFLILAGILVILFPKANEWYNDRQQDKLLEDALQSYSDNSDSEPQAQSGLTSSYAEVTRVLADESALNEADQAQKETKQETMEPGGQVMAIIEIDKIDLKLPVLEGATQANMKHAAAHMKETASLGEKGNAAIAAHRARTTGRLFNRLNEVEMGDTITVRTKDKTYNYEVYNISVVEPTDVSVLNGNDKDSILTLITCDPLVNPTHRLIVHAKLPNP
ncbi:class D sortase [Paenibacillus donghaensis]|uniref:Class C sortase n=1 Tax=Paenibacillus donghaensis TaxID=414771 RepID=A0A2Z2KU58_9BACL|nr:class D sortase [Paenibacillus donghaensis]ASA25572.1 class C sortase [Paenibacillus donghaensis]